MSGKDLKEGEKEVEKEGEKESEKEVEKEGVKEVEIRVGRERGEDGRMLEEEDEEENDGEY